MLQAGAPWFPLLAVLPAALASSPLPAPAESTGDVVVHRLRAGRVERLADGALCGAGDRIQLEYDAGRARHAVLFSVDGAGAVTLHHPARVDDGTALEETAGLVPYSFVLDDAPRFERFYLVTAAAPLDVREVLARADRGRRAAISLTKR